jgi:hypothetical protein
VFTYLRQKVDQMLILYDINDVREQAEKFQKEKLNKFFKKPWQAAACQP